MAGESRLTTDHDEIRRWVEERDGWPATVEGTAGSDEAAGLLRIDFPGYGGGLRLVRISWEAFFEKFDESELAFLYQEATGGEEVSRFNKLVSRDWMEEVQGTPGRGAAAKGEE